jgi:hypothetical protein
VSPPLAALRASIQSKAEDGTSRRLCARTLIV